MVKRSALMVCACTLWLAGCSGLPFKGKNSTGYLESDLRTVNRQPDPSSKLVYLTLTAELAVQRGQFDVALKNYLDLAQFTGDPRYAERATQLAVYLKKTDQAIVAATLWAAEDPGNPAVHRVLAMLYLKAGRTDEGIGEFRKLLATKSDDTEASLIELVKWLETEVPTSDALAIMARLAQQFPRNAELHFAYALLASDKGEHRLALAETEKALALHPSWSRASLLKAQVMAQMGDSTAAREAVQKALKSDPANTRLQLIHAQLLAKSGDVNGAEREMRGLIQKQPDNHDARLALASLLLEMGRIEKARHEFLRLTEVQKWRSQAMFYLGLIDIKQGNLESALVWFDRIDTGPLEFDARVNAINTLINLDRTDEARQRLGQLRRSVPKEALRLYLLEAELLNRSKNPAAAFKLLSEALEEMPDQPELLYSRALLAEQLGRKDVLEADLKLVINKNPEDANALNALGFSLLDNSDRLAEAGSYLERAIRIKPDEPAIMDSYGWLLYRQGKKTESLEYLKKAYTRLPDPEIGTHLGEVLWESGQKPEARRVFADVLKKAPDSEDILRVRQRYPDAFR